MMGVTHPGQPAVQEESAFPADSGGSGIALVATRRVSAALVSQRGEAGTANPTGGSPARARDAMIR
jgi:hypothetical protein